MKKKGMTLMMLVIYIVVLLILFGISVSTVMQNNKAEEITEETYKAIIREYAKEFETTKGYYAVKNQEIRNDLIEGSELIEYIPSISLEHSEYILIHEGKIKYNTTIVNDYVEEEYLEELVLEGILEAYTP